MSTEMVFARAPEVIVEFQYSKDDKSDLSAWNGSARCRP
jgi:hypothetical protein